MLYPITTETRNLIDLSGVWKFKLDDGQGHEEEWYAEKLDTKDYMAVPASYNDAAVYEKARNHIGTVWYEKEFTLPKHILGEQIILRFGSVTHNAEVYLNGEKITEHKGGFLPFEVKINEHLENGKNRVTVAVDNILDESTLPVGMYKEETVNGRTKKYNDPNFDFFNYAGIHRPVKIYTVPEVHVTDLTVSPVNENGSYAFDYEVETSGEAEKVEVVVQDEDGNVVYEGEGKTGKAGIEEPRLWEPMDSYLYDFNVYLKDASGEVVDHYVLPAGIRTVEVADGQFRINDKPFYFKGFGKHEDTYIHGRGFNEAANILDFNLMKWIGANSFRTAHYPYSEEMMRLADREGFVVIDETPAVGVHLNFMATLMGSGEKRDTWKEIRTMDHHREVIKDLVKRDKNHASVVMWSIANEPASEEEGAYDYFKPLYDLTKECDPQKRPATVVTHLMATPEKEQVADLVDVLAMNRYYGWYTQSGDLEDAKIALESEFQHYAKSHPDKPIIMTEYGADTVAGFHAVDPIMFTEEYQKLFLEANHEIFDKTKNFVGEHIWNFADFETSQGVIRVQGNKKGMFTRDRKPKMAAHYMKERWENIPHYNYKK
ncbi:beta-glucuronidase [Salinicoccus roseus]|uniref:Beta-glucuronidase n=1 Tax=Salinicoccus roseus TaxID=45670 RepID=A0A0C2HKP8_9STAP|nr:beta-glucuronidase [Salinicoccus roseus]KIH70181.1 beta-glucuronidase [Salinicoccus roseus]MDB0581029.1 beta-glucuronidase [Salinicoccus roseus]